MLDYRYDAPVLGRWVVGKFTGQQAKHVLEQASSSLGYFVQEQDGNRLSPTVLAAFRYCGPMPVPEYLVEVIDPYKISTLEKRRLDRMGIGERGLVELFEVAA